MSALTGNLRRSTAELASLFQKRMAMLRGRTDIIDRLRPLEGARFPDLTRILREPRYAVGIDGSMDYDEVLEMLLFYVAAGGYRCSFNIVENAVKFDLSNAKRTQELFASAVVPLWEEDLLNVVPDAAEQIETDVDFRTALQRIPFALMTMAELYLALRVLSRGDLRILFLDRPFSGTYPSLYRDAAFTLARKQLALIGLQTRYGPVSHLDLRLSTTVGTGLGYVPPRSLYLPYAGLNVLLRKGRVSIAELQELLSIESEAVAQMLAKMRAMNDRYDRSIFSEDGEVLTITEGVRSSWQRVHALAVQIAERIFEPSVELNHPLLMDNGKWISVGELNALNLVLMGALIEQSMEREVIVVGLAKDTTATDFTRAALPTALHLANANTNLPGLKSDKALLTILSTANASSLRTPWRTFAYDGCLATAIATPEGKTKLAAARQKITRERLFVRCYFQLRSFRHDPEIRAPVFLYDRLHNPSYDDGFDRKMVAKEREDISELRLFMEAGPDRSLLDDVILLILAACDNPEVLEAYGHNQLLYLADKLVKGEVQLMKGLLRGVVDLELTPLARKEKVFSIARRFRDLRAESESARRQSSQGTQEVRMR